MQLFGVVQAHRTSSNLLEPHHYRDSKVFRVLSHEFGVVRLYRTFSIYIVTEIARCAGCLCTCSGWFKPHHYRDSKVFRVLSHEFGVFRLYRTFSIYIVTGETRSAGCLCTSSGCFKHIEPRRTFPNHIIKEIARCVEFCHTSSGWFDCTEPSLSTSLQGQQCMQGDVHLFGVVQAHRTSSNLEPHHYKDSKVCRVLSHEFGVVRLYRTFSIYIVTGETRYAGCLCTCSGWFKHIEPRRTFPNHIITEIATITIMCHSTRSLSQTSSGGRASSQAGMGGQSSPHRRLCILSGQTHSVPGGAELSVTP